MRSRIVCVCVSAGKNDSIASSGTAPYFTDAERAVLALGKAVTRLSDRTDAVPDHIWQEAAAHYDEQALAALLLSIAVTNVYHRLNVASRQVAGEWTKSDAGSQA